MEGGEFRVVVDNNSPHNKYIQSVSINGKPLAEGFTFSHEEFKAGGELRFLMTGDKNLALRTPLI